MAAPHDLGRRVHRDGDRDRPLRGTGRDVLDHGVSFAALHGEVKGRHLVLIGERGTDQLLDRLDLLSLKAALDCSEGLG